MESDGNDTAPVSPLSSAGDSDDRKGRGGATKALKPARPSRKRVFVRKIARDDDEDDVNSEEEEEEDSVYDGDGEHAKAELEAARAEDLRAKKRGYEITEKDRVLYRLSGDKVSRITSNRVSLHAVSTLMIRICVDNGPGCIFTIPAQAHIMGVSKRRVHDVVGVYRSVGLVGRPPTQIPGQTQWLGYPAMQEYLRDVIAPVGLKKHAGDLYSSSDRVTMGTVTAFVASCIINERFSIDDLPREILPAITAILLEVAEENGESTKGMDTPQSIQKAFGPLMRRVYDVTAILCAIGRNFFVVAPPKGCPVPQLVPVPSFTSISRRDMVKQQREAYNAKRREQREAERRAKEEAEKERKRREKEAEERACNGACGCCAKLRALRQGNGGGRGRKKQPRISAEEDESTAPPSLNSSAVILDKMPVPPPPLSMAPMSLSMFPMTYSGGGEDVTMHGFFLSSIADVEDDPKLFQTTHGLFA